MTGQSVLWLPPDQAVATISATIVEELQPALEQLEQFSSLTDNWDSYGAVAISPLAIATARELAAGIISKHALSIRPADYSFDVVPTPDGGVQLEWDVSLRHLEIAIRPDGSLQYLFVANDDGERQAALPDNASRPDVLWIADDILRDRDG